MRLTTLFSLIQSRFAWRSQRSRWSARRQTSWPQCSAAETLENRCLLTAGDVDRSFGIEGKIETGFTVSAMQLQSDGKIVLAGTLGSDLVVARFDTDGLPDPSFGIAGVIISNHVGNDYVDKLAIQANGKIVVATRSVTETQERHGDYRIDGFWRFVTVWHTAFELVRYNTDGSRDWSFAPYGPRTLDSDTSQYARVTGMVIQTDGKILLAGRKGLERYNNSGSLDTSFNGTGKITQPFGYRGDVDKIAIQADGKIVVTGEEDIGYYVGQFIHTLARYNSNGSLDTSLDEDGKLTLDFRASRLELQADGKIVVAQTSNGNFTSARYNSNGTLDTSFDGDGAVSRVENGTFDRVWQSDGKIIVAGDGIARYNTDGSLDTSFGTDGSVASSGKFVALQADGKIITSGGQQLARFKSDFDPPPAIAPADVVSVAENEETALFVIADDPDWDVLDCSCPICAQQGAG